MQHEITITVNEVPLDVRVWVTNPRPATLHTPADEFEVEVEQVFLDDIEVTDMLATWVRDNIQEQVHAKMWDLIEAELEDAMIAKAEARAEFYRMMKEAA
jgi:hypothetical protein